MNSDVELTREMRLMIVMLSNALHVVAAGQHEQHDREAWACSLNKLANDLLDGDAVTINGEVRSPGGHSNHRDRAASSH